MSFSRAGRCNECIVMYAFNHIHKLQIKMFFDNEDSMQMCVVIVAELCIKLFIKIFDGTIKGLLMHSKYKNETQKIVNKKKM